MQGDASFAIVDAQAEYALNKRLLMCPAAIFLCSSSAGYVLSDKSLCLSDGAYRWDRQTRGDRLPMPGLRHQPIQPVGNDRCPG